MVTKVHIVLVFLPMALHALEPLTETFRTEYVCNADYGVNVGESIQRTKLSCGGKCSRTSNCHSFLYDPQSKTCRLNSQTLINPTYGCSILLIYGYIFTLIDPIPEVTSPVPFVGKHVNDPCLVTTDCIDAFSECKLNVCTCQLDYVFDTASLTCIAQPIQESTKKGTKIKRK